MVESIVPIFPPFVELTDHVAFGSRTLFRAAENDWDPPAGTIAVVGVTARPCPTVIVKTAVLDVISVVVDVLVVDVVGFCGVTAVMFTWPLFVVGTDEGAQ